MIKTLVSILFLGLAEMVAAQTATVSSPDGNLQIAVEVGDKLSYSVAYKGKPVVFDSSMGFELKDERPMDGNFLLLNEPKSKLRTEEWKPVVQNKHAEVKVVWNEMKLNLQEKTGDLRQMQLALRVYNDAVAFRYQLYGGRHVGNRHITRELTTFAVPSSSKAWVADYKRYKSPQEAKFIAKAVTDIQTTTIGGLPFLIEENKNTYLAITEAYIRNYPGFFIGTDVMRKDGETALVTKLSPLPGETEKGVKVRFAEDCTTPWRVIMVGENPGKFIESEVIHALNPANKIADSSWIKPGMCAWDHWWSGEVKMTNEEIKKYIDLAAEQGWPYMLIDWQWYGPFNKPEADITKPALQLDMPMLLDYARSKKVRCWLWLYCTDVNKNDAYKKAFPLYKKWGIAGVKIDFMDRQDQEMVNWYRRIVEAAADNQLMIDLHGAYKPDGIERTYPNFLTREGVMGEEHYKFGREMTPEHNVTLAFTRMLAGPMDYTPGGFLNVTHEAFKPQVPTVVDNTRCAELAKFVVYDSPFAVVCESPAYMKGQPGTDFLKIVPTVWDDTRFLCGYPDTYVAIAKRKGSCWFIGILNNSIARTVELQTSFLPKGVYQLEYWADGKGADRRPSQVLHRTVRLRAGAPIKVRMAKAGGYVCRLSSLSK